MKKLEGVINWIIIGLYSFSFFALILDSYKNPKKIENVTLFDPSWLLLLVLLINLLARLNKMIVIPSWFLNINRFLVFPFFLFMTISLSVWGYLSPANYVYSQLPLNTLPILLIGLAAFFIGLINAKTSWLKRNTEILVFLTPIAFLFIGTIIWLWPNDFLISLNKEDHLIENTQFIFLLLACLFSGATSRQLFKSKNKVWAILYALATLAIFIIAGEEISWGQRIFGIVTPEYLANQNSQGEINVHNLTSVSKFVGLVYMFIGIYGALSWILFKIKKVRELNCSRFFIIPWYLAFYFLPIFIYNLLLPPTKPHGLGEWSEMTELLMYAGALAFIFETYLFLKKPKGLS